MAESTTIYKFKADLKDLDKLNRKLLTAKNRLDSLGKGTKAFKAQNLAIKDLDATLQKGNNNIKNFNKSAQTLNSTGSKMTAIFRSASIAIVSAFAFRAIIGGLKGVITTFSDFESQMSAVKAISGATEKEFKKLESSAKRLGSTTVFTATQVGKLQEEFARLGFTSQEILAAQDGTLALAAGTGESLASSAETAGSVLRAFGIDASQAGRVADIMGASFTNSALNLERFTQSMKFVAPIARSAGFTLEETSAQLMILANNGLSGSLAGNALKNIFLRLGDANSKLNKSLGRTVQGLPQMIEALKEMKDESFGLTEATELLDKRSAPAFLTLLNNIEGLESSLGILNEAEGVISQMAQIRLNNLEGDFTLLKSATEGLGIAIGELFDGGLRNIINGLTQFVERLQNNEKALNNLKRAANAILVVISALAARFVVARTAAGLAALSMANLRNVVAAQIVVYRTAAATLGGFAGALKGISAVIRANPFGLLLTAVSLLVGYFMDLNDEMGENEMMQRRVNDQITKQVNLAVLAGDGTSERSKLLRKLKQDHGELLENFDVEIMKTEDLIRLNKVLTESEQLRVDIANLKDMETGLSEENRQKLRNIELNKLIIKNDLDAKKISYNVYQDKIKQLHDEREEILKTAATDVTSITKVRKLREEQLQKMLKGTEELSEFRILKNKSTRLNLRKEYKADLEEFRKYNKDKQEVEVKKAEDELELLKNVQIGREFQSSIQKFNLDKDIILLDEANKAFTEFKSKLKEDGSFDSWVKGNEKWLNDGQLLNITVDELETKVTNFNAALDRSGQGRDKSFFSTFRLAKTKDEFKKFFDTSTKAIKDLSEQEEAAVENKFKSKEKDLIKELALNKKNIRSIKSQREDNFKDQAKRDLKFFERNANNYDVLKNIDKAGWELLAKETEEGANARLKIFSDILIEEQLKEAQNSDIIKNLAAEKDIEIEKLGVVRQGKQEENARQILKNEIDNRENDLNNFFKNNKDKQDLAERTAIELKAQAQREKDAGILNAEQLAAAEIQIEQDKIDKIKALQDERIAKVVETYDQISQIALSVSANIAEANIADLNAQFDRQKLDRENAFRDELAQAELAGQDTEAMQEAFNDREVTLEAKKEAEIRNIQRRQFQLNKVNDIIQATLNGYLAITRVAGETGLGAIVAAPIMSAFVGAQIAGIAAQKFIGEDGGIVPGDVDKFASGGMVKGARHAQGGVKFAVGGTVAELEGGEAVINRKATAMFKPQLSAMNVAGGGVAFENGGITPSRQAAQKSFDSGFNSQKIVSALASVINTQKVIVTESDISNSQLNVQIQETQSNLF
jgi:TP901 family phage tail tape measure protein